MIFFDIHDAVVSRYPTLQEKGLYYIQDLHFISVDQATISHIQALPTPCDDGSTADDNTVRTGTPQSHLDHVDFDLPLHVDNLRMQLRPCQATLNPAVCPAIIGMAATIKVTIAMLGTRSTMETDILAHCSEKRLRFTQKLVDGIPSFHASRIPPCRDMPYV